MLRFDFGLVAALNSVAARMAERDISWNLRGMPLVIEDPVTGKYMSATGGWTKNPGAAKSFDQVLRAFEEIGERRLSGVRILICEDGRSTEVARGIGP